MSEVFDPEKVERIRFRDNWRDPNQGVYVESADYDKLLDLRKQAIDLAVKYGGIDGSHHRAWVIDQMVRILSGDQYERIVSKAKSGEGGPDTYEWDEGIAP